MRRMSLAVRAGLFLTGGSLLLAQSPVPQNPHLGDRQAIRDGMTQYRLACANCHGMDARGFQGPDLAALMAGGATDERLFETIRKGVPGTEMPASRAPDDEIWRVLAYLRSLDAVPAADGAATGNAANGEQIFTSSCTGCHRAGGRGGWLGPDLSRIGGARSRAALVREIRTPSEVVTPGYETVTLVMKDGRRVRGVRKNDDLFSIQVMDTRERIQGFVKGNLQDVIYEKTSLMPEFGPDRLNESQLGDLLAYLSTLRGPAPSAR